MEQEIELWEKNGPKGVLLNKFCCMAFENKGRYRGSTKLCVDVKGNEKLYTGFILGFRPRHWDMWDAREFEDTDEKGVLYGRRVQELTKKGVDVLDIELQVGLYRVVCCDGTLSKHCPCLSCWSSWTKNMHSNIAIDSSCCSTTDNSS